MVKIRLMSKSNFLHLGSGFQFPYFIGNDQEEIDKSMEHHDSSIFVVSIKEQNSREMKFHKLILKTICNNYEHS